MGRFKKKGSTEMDYKAFYDWFINVPEKELLKKFRESIMSSDENYGEYETEVGVDNHQTIMNIAYNWWQQPENNGDYVKMIEHMSKTYGFLYGGLVLAGKYNQQVGNGGHVQYYDNGLADGTGGCFDEHDFDHPMHQIFVNWLLKLKDKLAQPESLFEENSSYIPIMDEVIRIAQKFLEADIDTEKTYEEDYYDEDEDAWLPEEVENPDYGRLCRSDADNLDKAYYEVNDRFMEIMEYVASIGVCENDLSDPLLRGQE